MAKKLISLALILMVLVASTLLAFAAPATNADDLQIGFGGNFITTTGGPSVPTLRWAQTQYGEDGYPQLWVALSYQNELHSVSFIRLYTDENGEAQTEIYDMYSLKGVDNCVRYRTLRAPGQYLLHINAQDGSSTKTKVVITLEDTDGNGVVDTMTMDGVQTLLEIEGAITPVEEPAEEATEEPLEETTEEPAEEATEEPAAEGEATATPAN